VDDLLPADPLTPTEAAGLVAWRLAHGARLRTRDVQEMCGLLAYNSAYHLMCRLARVIPIARDDAGFWCAFSQPHSPA